MRTGARDALLLAASRTDDRGRVFGFQQSLDSAGAVVGPLVALVLLHTFNSDIRTVLVVAVIPSFAGLVTVSFVRDVRWTRTEGRENASAVDTQLPSRGKSWGDLPRELKTFFVATGLFALGNSSDSFLILRARNVGLDLSLVIVAYVFYNIVYSVMSTPAGTFADRWGARRVYVIGVVIYIFVYLGFALNTAPSVTWMLFGTYGIYIALTDSVSRALVSSFIPAQRDAGAIFGLLQGITSAALVLASVVGGLLWSLLGARATFLFGAGCATLALVVFANGLRDGSSRRGGA